MITGDGMTFVAKSEKLSTNLILSHTHQSARADTCAHEKNVRMQCVW